MTQCGGAALTAATSEHQGIADTVKAAARSAYLELPPGEPLPADTAAWPCFEVVEALEQVVAGTNFFLKVRVSADGSATEYVQLRVYEPLPHVGTPPELAGFRKGTDAQGPLQYF